jgi:hypothetical protein
MVATRAEIEQIIEEYLAKQRGDVSRPKYGGVEPDVPLGGSVDEGGDFLGLESDTDPEFDTSDYGITGLPSRDYTDDMARVFGGEKKKPGKPGMAARMGQKMHPGAKRVAAAKSDDELQYLADLLGEGGIEGVAAKEIEVKKAPPRHREMLGRRLGNM